MKKEEVAQYQGKKVKVILKGSGNILRVMDNAFVILDRYGDEVTVDYEVCGLITLIRNLHRKKSIP